MGYAPFLMLTFSLSLTTGCQEANEKAVEVNEEAAETKAGNKKYVIFALVNFGDTG